MTKPESLNPVAEGSNVENIGSDMDKAARHAAAMTEVGDTTRPHKSDSWGVMAT